jgi:hypothetical protein
MNILKDLAPSIVTLLLGFLGIYYALKRHRESIEIQKKQDLIIKQQKLATDIIDLVFKYRDAIEHIFDGLHYSNEENEAKDMFKNEKYNTDMYFLVKLYRYYNYNDIFRSILNIKETSDIYFPIELKYLLEKLFDNTLCLRLKLEEIALNHNYELEYTTEEKKDNKNYVSGKSEIKLDDIDKIIKEIRNNLKQYISLDKVKWNKSL